MKKLFFTLLLGLFLLPSQVFADYYEYDKVKLPPKFPVRSTVIIQIAFGLDYYTGDLTITPIDPITGLEISITAGGVTYLDTTVSLSAGQSYTDCLSFLSVGTYILTLSTADGIIDQYEITVEDD